MVSTVNTNPVATAWLVAAKINPRSTFLALKLNYRLHWIDWIWRVLDVIGEEQMARGKSKPTAAANGGGTWQTEFVNIPLGGASLETVQLTLPTAEIVFDTFDELLLEGYKFSFGLNAGNDAVMCTVTCRADGSVNKGLTCTSFAADWFTALQVSLYKHFQITKGDWRSVASISATDIG